MQTTKATMNRKCLIKGNRENQYISADTHTHTQTGQSVPVRSCRQNFRIRIRHVVQSKSSKGAKEKVSYRKKERGNGWRRERARLLRS